MSNRLSILIPVPSWGLRLNRGQGLMRKLTLLHYCGFIKPQTKLKLRNWRLNCVIYLFNKRFLLLRGWGHLCYYLLYGGNFWLFHDLINDTIDILVVCVCFDVKVNGARAGLRFPIWWDAYFVVTLFLFAGATAWWYNPVDCASCWI